MDSDALKKLERLLSGGMLTEAEYEQRRARLVAGAEDGAAPPEVDGPALQDVDDPAESAPHTRSETPSDLVICPDCRRSVSDRSWSCPECGCPLSEDVSEPRATTHGSRGVYRAGLAERWAAAQQRPDVRAVVAICTIVSLVVVAFQLGLFDNVKELARAPVQLGRSPGHTARDRPQPTSAAPTIVETPPTPTEIAESPLASDPPSVPSPAPEDAPATEKSATFRLFEAVCGYGNATEEHCLKCPSFTDFAGQEGPWKAIRGAGVKLTPAKMMDRLVTMEGCQAGGSLSSVVTIRVGENGWQRVAFLPLVDVNNCVKVPRGSEREALLCSATEVGMGDAVTRLIAVSVEDEAATVTELAEAEDNTGTCSNTYVAESIETELDDADGDGVADIVVSVSSVKAEIPSTFGDGCAAVESGFRLPAPTMRTTRFSWDGGKYVAR